MTFDWAAINAVLGPCCILAVVSIGIIVWGLILMDRERKEKEKEEEW